MSDFIPAPEGFVIDGYKVVGFGHVSIGQRYWDGQQIKCWRYTGGISEGRYFILEPLPRRAANHTCTVSVEEIYGKLPEIPEGYEEMGFGMKRPEGATHYMGTGFRVYPAKATDLPICVIWLREVSA